MIEFYGAIFTIIIGAMLHFTYEWSDRSLWIAFVAPTNESVFEHLKLLMTPFLLWTLHEYVRYGQFIKSFIPAKTAGLLAGMLFMVLLFYAYTTLGGKNDLAVDILLFIGSVVTAFAVSHALRPVSWLGFFAVRLTAKAVLLILAAAFAAFSIYPPRHPLFTSPPGCGRPKFCNKRQRPQK